MCFDAGAPGRHVTVQARAGTRVDTVRASGNDETAGAPGAARSWILVLEANAIAWTWAGSVWIHAGNAWEAQTRRRAARRWRCVAGVATSPTTAIDSDSATTTTTTTTTSIGPAAPGASAAAAIVRGAPRVAARVRAVRLTTAVGRTCEIGEPPYVGAATDDERHGAHGAHSQHGEAPATQTITPALVSNAQHMLGQSAEVLHEHACP